MLTSEELIKEISTTLTKTKVVKLSAIIQKQQFSIKDLIDITFHPDKNIAFRAAWILENLLLQKPESYIEHLNYLNSRVKDVGNPSCKRHYAKILMHITAPKAPARHPPAAARFRQAPPMPPRCAAPRHAAEFQAGPIAARVCSYNCAYTVSRSHGASTYP